MSDYLNISDFLSPVNFNEISQDEGYRDGQIGKAISVYKAQKYPAKKFPDLDDAQLVILGCGEQRGSGLIHGQSEAPDLVRRQLYSLFYWHKDVKIADIGNIMTGSLFTDFLCCVKDSCS